MTQKNGKPSGSTRKTSPISGAGIVPISAGDTRKKAAFYGIPKQSIFGVIKHAAKKAIHHLPSGGAAATNPYAICYGGIASRMQRKKDLLRD